METNNFYKSVRMELLRRDMKLRDLYNTLDITNSYNWFWQVVKGYRTSPETIEKVKAQLQIKDQI